MDTRTLLYTALVILGYGAAFLSLRGRKSRGVDGRTPDLEVHPRAAPTGGEGLSLALMLFVTVGILAAATLPRLDGSVATAVTMMVVGIGAIGGLVWWVASGFARRARTGHIVVDAQGLHMTFGDESVSFRWDTPMQIERYLVVPQIRADEPMRYAGPELFLYEISQEGTGIGVFYAPAGIDRAEKNLPEERWLPEPRGVDLGVHGRAVMKAIFARVSPEQVSPPR